MTTTWVVEGSVYNDLVWSTDFGTTLDNSVPALWPVAIDGMPFLVEVQQLERTTLDALRQDSFQGATPSEQSLSTATAWVRTQRTWRYGAGQINADSQDDDSNNFNSQRMIDNWHLEPDPRGDGLRMMRNKHLAKTTKTLAQGPSTSVANANDTYAIANDGSLQKINNLGATTCTGMGAETVIGVASDGYTTWIMTRVDASHVKIYSALTGLTAFTVSATGSVALNPGTITNRLFYGNGFLLATMDNRIYSVSAAGAFSAVIDTISVVSTNIGISSITCTTNNFYFSCVSDTVTNLPLPVFRLTVDNTGAFGKFTVALPSLGPSENVNAILAKESVMVIGTSKGFRIATIDSTGNLGTGPLIKIADDSTGSDNCDVTSIARYRDGIIAAYRTAGVERYAQDVDTTIFTGGTPSLHVGLIWIDLGHFVTDLQPAWWFWWRAETTNTSKCFVLENRINPIMVDFNDYWTIGTTDLISPASYVTSWYSFGLDANKTFVDFEIHHDALASGDTVTVYFQKDDDTTWNQIGQSNVAGNYEPTTPFLILVNTRRMRFGIVAAAGDVTQATTPRIRRFQIRAFATPKRNEEIILPLIVHDMVRIGADEKQDAKLDTRGSYDALSALAQSGEPVYFQEGDRSYLVKVDKVQLKPDHYSMDESTGGYRFYQGYIVVRLLTL